MTKEEIFEFINKTRMFSLATVDGSQPHVRNMMLYKADENGIIFVTGKYKDIYKQLQANPAMEMCFFNQENGLQVRIEGSVELLDDLDLKKQVVEVFTFLKPFVESKGYEVLICYRVKNAKAVCWTMKTNFEPKEYIDL
ncbi:MAG: pyridoxamine 5'-phosphate oxidase family protein [Sedimentisphaerales bacterium]|nr:pyridoxamine 5'-phosphate oxidase family protein [Sedimentisphaerales bacterium]